MNVANVRVIQCGRRSVVSHVLRGSDPTRTRDLLRDRHRRRLRY